MSLTIVDFQEVLTEELRDIARDTINNKMLFERGDITLPVYEAVKCDVLSRTAVIERLINSLQKKYSKKNPPAG